MTIVSRHHRALTAVSHYSFRLNTNAGGGKMASNSRIRLANEIDIRDILKSRATCYDLPSADLSEVVDRTIEAAIDGEHVGLSDDIEVSLFALLDRFAAEKIIGRSTHARSFNAHRPDHANTASRI